MMARATAVSQTAIKITNKANICPSILLLNKSKATKFTFEAFNISSIPIKILIKFLDVIVINNPIENKNIETKK